MTIEKEKRNEEDEFNYWRITIADQGTGISRDDLKFMMQMGSSKKNSKRREIIEKMPVWMKPSGIFGIGLHSVFLLTDEVLIETRSIDTGENLVIRLTNPTDKKEHGNVYFQIITKPKEIELANNKKQKFKPWDFSNYGCKLSFICQDNKYHIWRTHQSINRDILSSKGNYDEKIIDKINDFFQNCYLKAALNNTHLDKRDNIFLFYSEKEKLELNIKFDTKYVYHNYYRGQLLEKCIHLLSNFHMIRVNLNLLDDAADNLLVVSRNDIKADVKLEIQNRVCRAIQDFFKSDNGKTYLTKMDEDDRTRIFAEYQLQNWEKPNYPNLGDWSNLLINNKKINELVNYDSIICFHREEIFSGLINEEEKRKQEENILSTFLNEKENYFKIFTRHHEITPEYSLALTFLKENGFNPVFYYIENDVQILELKKQTRYYNETILIHYCHSLLDNNLERRTIPCPNNYELLSLMESNKLPLLEKEEYWHHIFQSFTLDQISPRMLFPLARIGDKITVGDLDILAKRVHKNRADEKTTEEQIRKKYEEFINFLDDLLMKGNEEWRKLRGDEFNRYKKTN